MNPATVLDHRRGQPRKLDGEDASFGPEVTHVQYTVVRLDAALADREAETEAASIYALLPERKKQLLRLSRWQAPAFILDVNEDPVGGLAHAQ